MLSLRVTSPDGATQVHDLSAPEVTIGRSADNVIVLRGPGISGHHCMLVKSGGQLLVTERGSTNGTFLNHQRLTQPAPLNPGDRLYVGSHLLELVVPQQPAVAAPAPAPVAYVPAMAPATASKGSILRGPDPHRGWREMHAKLMRYAREWHRARRPRRLLLRVVDLPRARAWLDEATEQHQPPVDPLQRMFIERSAAAARWRTIRRVLGAVTAVAMMAALVFAGVQYAPAFLDDDPQSVAQPDVGGAVAVPIAVTPPPVKKKVVAETWIDHRVIPAETIDDIAGRYGIPVKNVARWNQLNPDDPAIEVGQQLRIKPKKDPLPQQEILYEVERREASWKKLSSRFGVEVRKLKAYNPGVRRPRPGKEITVWIDPKPLTVTRGTKVPIFETRPGAYSIGTTNGGTLENGIRMPDSTLYKRRNHTIMFGSSWTIKWLQTGLAQFRQDVDFDGVIVVADLSKQRGGHFPPHKSHQSGRDVDIWLPTLRGVYKKSHIGKDRKPLPNEIDFFATWGLVRALISTGQVKNIFIVYDFQEKVYQAAKIMGASDEELREAMQYPRGRAASGILGHSAGHTRHIHVRFKCGPQDARCVN